MDHELDIERTLQACGIPRRRFLKYCGALVSLLGLPPSAAAQVAAALGKQRKPVVVWLEFQDCAGNSEAILRASHPSITEVVLNLFSWEYHETVMAAAGRAAEEVLERVVKEEKGNYIAIVEGSIPTKGDGYCTIGGKSAMAIARHVCPGAAAVIAVGSCAVDGGPQRSAPNPTGAIGVQEALPDIPVVNVSGCPHNPDNTAALLAHWVTFRRMPALDEHRRPLFAHGKIIHDMCERRAHFDAGRFVEAWDDTGARNGYCLYKMGCKGPQATWNCPVVRWNGSTSWPVKSGHGCAACASYRFWDRTLPLYRRLQDVPGGFGFDLTAAQIGGLVVGATAAGVIAHGVASAVRSQVRPRGEVRHGPTADGAPRGLVEREGPPQADKDPRRE
jgi:hydrogenase small subunit